MTQTKINRLRTELIAKHGDRDLIHIEDTKTHKRVYTLKISNIVIRNAADLKEVERIIKEGKPRIRRVEIPAEVLNAHNKQKGVEQ